MFDKVMDVMHSLAGAMRSRRYKKKDLEELTVALAELAKATESLAELTVATTEITEMAKKRHDKQR